jgi:signal transduction histidine kinase
MFAELTALVTFIVGIAVLWTNPRRFANQAFGLLSLLILIWLCLVYLGGAFPDFTLFGKHFAWHRLNAIIAAIFPWTIWIIKEALATATEPKIVFRKSLAWLAIGLCTALIACGDSFIFADPITGDRRRGTAYLLYCAAGLITHFCLLIITFGEMRNQTGIRRIQMQFLVFNVTLAIVLGVLFIAIGNITPSSFLRRLGFVFIIAAYALTGWSIAFYRVFDVTQILMSVGQRIAISLLLGFGCLALWSGYHRDVASTFDLIVGFIVWGSAILWLDGRLHQWLSFSQEQSLLKMRRATIELARNEPNTESLVERFEIEASDQSKARFASLLLDDGDKYSSAVLRLFKESAIFAALCSSGWATPESLERRRSTQKLVELRRYLVDNELGLLLTVPRGSPTPSLLVALGTKTNDWPFTYPEVERLQNIAELMDNILTRSRLAAQAAMQARMEHLAMMSRGLAHDLKNLITPVSSFLIHTDNQYPTGSAEAEVHAAARRSVRVMTEYVREAMFFSDRLNPRFEPVELPRIFSALTELIAPRAAAHGVSVATHADFTRALVADGVLLQRMLANLVNNAIDASPDGKTVNVSATTGPAGWLRLRVVDQGCGIANEELGRIFEPYYTTKAFGEEVRGFGLGLTICQKIVDLHSGTVTVQSELGRGTTVTVDLPSKPPPRPVESAS